MTSITRLALPSCVVSAALVSAAALHALICRPAMAAVPAQTPFALERRDERLPRTVSVSGKAEINTAPDELTISAGVQVYDASLRAAKKEADRRARSLLQLAAAHGVEAHCVQTDEFRISPRVEGSFEARRITGYDVSKHLTITVRDVATLEALLVEMFDSGANQLDGVHLQSSHLVELRKQAREQALRAAREKAEVAARELGQKLGRPLKIEESPEAPYYGYNARQLANYQESNATAAAAGETMAPGKIKVEAAVSVLYELVD